MSAAKSPYQGRPEPDWPKITRRLIEQHPLKTATILEIAEVTWERLWSTTLGAGLTQVPLKDLAVPAAVVGYFFEILFAKELEYRFPKLWRGHQAKDDKDLVYLPDPALSIEIKTSGQFSFKIFGNRSYAQEAQSESLVKKGKSGYYITMNFTGRTMNLLRFGWIDASDWSAQLAPTGQMAGLGPAVYRHKLVPIHGRYRLAAPVQLVRGVGPSAASALDVYAIRTVGDLLNYKDVLPAKLARIRAAAIADYATELRDLGIEED